MKLFKSQNIWNYLWIILITVIRLYIGSFLLTSLSSFYFSSLSPSSFPPFYIYISLSHTLSLSLSLSHLYQNPQRTSHWECGGYLQSHIRGEKKEQSRIEHNRAEQGRGENESVTLIYDLNTTEMLRNTVQWNSTAQCVVEWNRAQ